MTQIIANLTNENSGLRISSTQGESIDFNDGQMVLIDGVTEAFIRRDGDSVKLVDENGNEVDVKDGEVLEVSDDAYRTTLESTRNITNIEVEIDTTENYLDFSTLDKIKNIEKIDLSSKDIKGELSLEDVISMTDDNNILEISGEKGSDKIKLISSEWTKNIGASNDEYSVYEGTSGSDTITLKITPDILTEII